MIDFDPLYIRQDRFNSFIRRNKLEEPLKKILSPEKINFLGFVGRMAKRRTFDWISRIGHSYDGWNRNITSDLEMPTLLPHNLKYEEVCDRVGAKISNTVNSSDRQLLVTWSGGIDSTTSLVAVMKNGINYNKLVILMTDTSIAENPSFYQNFIENKIKCVNTNDFCLLKREPNRYYHTGGMFGDQLFAIGDGVRFCRQNNIELHQPWINYEDKILEYIDNSWAVNEIKKTISMSPVPIVTVIDFFWWINFNFKWMEIYFRRFTLIDLYGLVRNKDSDYVSKSIASEVDFFSDIDFQIWALSNTGMNNEKLSIPGISHKMLSKNYILKFDGDMDYWREKDKERSLSRIINFEQANYPLMIDTNMKAYYDNSILSKLLQKLINL